MRALYSDLKRARLRPTAGRVAILKVFHDYPGEHLSVDQVYRRVAEADDAVQCSLASVYRALPQLLDAGLITSAWIGEQRVVYELQRGAPHAHLVCNGCAAVHDLHEPALESQHAALALAQGFRYAQASLVVFGRCASCADMPARSGGRAQSG